MPGTWSEDELIIAIEFYLDCPERMHTDSHQKCRQMARMLGRSPGALDRIIRNIKFVATGGTGLEHASRRIHELVGNYLNDHSGLKRRARAIRNQRGWPLLDCNH